MPAQYLMAIDAGTGSVRAVLFHPDGTQLGCMQREWEHREDPVIPAAWISTGLITGNLPASASAAC